jgi:hypothetical protein
MDFNALWTRASAAATEVATAAHTQASRAAAAAQEQAELLQKSDAWNSLEQTFLDIAANTKAVAEQSERNFQAMMVVDTTKARARALAESAPRAFGVDDDLAEFWLGVTPETFTEFPVGDESEEEESKEDENNEDDADETTKPKLSPSTTDTSTKKKKKPSRTSSPWRETHARLVLLKIPEVRDLRDLLVPSLMDDSRFWRIYFRLCAPRLARVEQAASAAVARSRARRTAVAAQRQAEIRNQYGEPSVPISVGPADAASALALEFGGPGGSDDDETASGSGLIAHTTETQEGNSTEIKPNDLESYLNDLLGGSSSDEETETETGAPDVENTESPSAPERPKKVTPSPVVE